MTLGFAVLISACVILCVMTVLWGVAVYLSDNSIADVFYGPVFLLTTFALVWGATSPHPAALLLLMLIMAWSLRLAFRIARKNIGRGEDARYRAWREVWQARGKVYVWVRSYLQVFLLQGAVIFFVLFPVILVVGAGSTTYPAVLFLGALVWCMGFLFEVVADYQLDAFLHNPANAGKIMQYGLFRYSRRPNYFGESLMWWGIAIIALGSVAFPLALLALISPVTITYIVYAITGPMLERRWERNSFYQEYKARTNYFVPWFPRQHIVNNKK